MIGAAQAAEAIYQTVIALPEVTTGIGGRFYPNTAPADVASPFGRYYLSAGGAVAKPAGRGVSQETVTYTVELLDRGESLGNIVGAATAIQTALHRLEVTTGAGYYVTGTYLRSTSFPLGPEMGTTYVRLAGDFEFIVGYPG